MPQLREREREVGREGGRETNKLAHARTHR